MFTYNSPFSSEKLGPVYLSGVVHTRLPVLMSMSNVANMVSPRANVPVSRYSRFLHPHPPVAVFPDLRRVICIGLCAIRLGLCCLSRFFRFLCGFLKSFSRAVSASARLFSPSMRSFSCRRRMFSLSIRVFSLLIRVCSLDDTVRSVSSSFAIISAAGR